jgi:hypothetical protein
MAINLAINGPAINSAAASKNAYVMKTCELLVESAAKEINPCKAGSKPSPNPIPNIPDVIRVIFTQSGKEKPVQTRTIALLPAIHMEKKATDRMSRAVLIDLKSTSGGYAPFLTSQAVVVGAKVPIAIAPAPKTTRSQVVSCNCRPNLSETYWNTKTLLAKSIRFKKTIERQNNVIG